jgi:hypothetical protein
MDQTRKLKMRSDRKALVAGPLTEGCGPVDGTITSGC